MTNDDKYDEFISKVEEALLDKAQRLYNVWEKDYFKNLFYEDLKIIGGAFTVLEAVSNLPLLLFRKEYNHSQDVKDCDFFWFPYEAKYFAVTDAEIIDRLFLTTRESQRLTENAPDFLRFIHEKEYKFSFLTNKKTQYNSQPIIYCDNSEILIFLLCYLELIKRIKAHGYERIIYSPHTVETISIINDSISVNDDRVANVFSDYCNGNNEILNPKLYQSLGLVNSNNKTTELFKSLKIRLLEIARSTSLTSLGIKLDREEIKRLGVKGHDDIQKAVNVLLSKIFRITDYTSYENSLQKLHLLARFPIIPYLEILLKRNEKIGVAHLVFPVWKSFTFSPRVKIGPKGEYNEHNVVLALLTVDDSHYSDEGFNYKFSRLSRVIRRLEKATSSGENKFSTLVRMIRRLGQVTADTIFYEKFAVKNLQQQAIKAALSQVMARNMSHNIGSHVLSRMVETGTIRNFIASSNQDGSGAVSNKTHQYQGFSFNDSYAEEPENRIASFNSYMKSRMDYLADVTTGVPTVENSKWFIKEVLSGIDKNRLLLDRISGISDFHYRIRFRNSVSRENDNTDEDAIKDHEAVNDLMVSIPNDVLGSHALYIIIENIIRNCAKHGENGDKGYSAETPMNICIDIKEFPEPEGNDLYEVTIYDDSEVAGKVTINQDEEVKYRRFFSEANETLLINRLDKLVFDQNYRLNQSVLENGVLRQGAWGLIEMDASAAYLRKIPVEQIDNDHFDIDLRQSPDSKTSYYPARQFTPRQLNILKAISVDEKYLGYRFLLFKPREVLVIDDNNTYRSLDDKERNILLKHGVLVCDAPGNNGKFVYDPNVIYNHKLVVVISDDPDKIIAKNKTGISERILKINSKHAVNHSALNLLPSDIEGFIAEIWKYYIRGKDYQFYEEYYGLPRVIRKVIKDILKDKVANGCANYSDHGKGYQTDPCDFKEIKYGLINGFMPKEDEIVKGIQFIESVHTKIVILDERIQEYANHGTYKPIEGDVIHVRDIYKKTNIYVPDDVVCNLGAQVYDSAFGAILKVFADHRDASYFVIHLGVIEKLIESQNRRADVTIYDKEHEIKEFLEDIVCSNSNNIDYNKLVIISGRGRPHNLPANTRYLNYSIISQYMIDVRFKYLLSEAVFSARKLH